jgi:hypothetical protein
MDSAGRRIIRGPVSNGPYFNVHIISDTVGVLSYGTVTVEDSVIEAPVCIRTGGSGNLIRNNHLDCETGIEFTSGPIINNVLEGNVTSGRLSNSPDIFGR